MSDYQDDLKKADAIKEKLPIYPSNLARLLAEDVLDDLDGEDRLEDRIYYLARWLDAALSR